MISALIFAGGSGIRMKNNDGIPKQFIKINNKEILIHTIEKFENCEDVSNIVIVCKDGWKDFLKQRIDFFNIKKVSKILIGGKTGFESRKIGLDYLHSIRESNDDLVLIHDGVRPLVSPEFISKNIKEAKLYGNAITFSPAIETIVLKNENKIVKREDCLLARAPQTFFLNEIFDCYSKAKIDNVGETLVDSASIASFYGLELNFIEGPADNIKITSQVDLYCAQALINKSGEKNE